MDDISIELEKVAYLPGEIINGRVILELNKPVKARSVKLEIICLEETVVRVGSGKYKQIYRERNYILKNNIILHNPMYDEDLELNLGRYSFEFEFRLPEDALPTYRGANARVTYNLVARVDVPWWVDKVKWSTIYVFRNREELGSMTAPAKFTSDNFMDGVSKKPCFGVELKKTGFLAGEAIEGKIFMYNMTASKVRNIYIRLLGQELATAQGHQVTIIRFKHEIEVQVYDMMEGVPKVFFLHIPKNVPSSYEGIYSTFGWGVQVGLDIPLGLDVKAFYPITVLH